jgi:hypothetical protein
LSSAIGVIQGFHAIIGGMSQQPHWFLNDADARRYGQAMANAARHFPMKAAQKTIDVSMLLITAFSIEAPRIAMSMQLARAKNSRPIGAPRGPAQVFQFINPNPPASGTSPAATQPASSGPAAGGDAGVPVQDMPPDPSSEQGAIGGEPAA